MKICPNCGMTEEEFRRKGLLGCAKCYKVFREEIMKTVKKVQGRTSQACKRPSVDAGDKSGLHLEQERLKESLAKANHDGRTAEVDEIKRRLSEIDRKLKTNREDIK